MAKENKNIRSEYIKNLVEDKEELSKTLSETAKSAISDILESEVKKGFRQILTEANEDDFEVEDVKDETTADDATETTVADETTDTEDGGDETVDTEVEVDSDSEAGEGADEGASGEEDNEIWGDLEQLKDDEGEYDLTQLDNDSAIKVLKVMNPENDGIRVMKEPNGAIKLTDDNTETEYIIDIDGALDSEEPEAEDDALDFEVDITESTNPNLGYTDDYQKKTAMTTPDNHEPADSKETYSMDAGVPKGTEKPWVGQKRGDTPFSQKVNEGEVEECGGAPVQEEEQIDETMTSTENSANARGTGMTHANTNSKQQFARNGHVQSKETRGTGEGYKPANESVVKIKKMANQIFKENKELKKLAGDFKAKLEESVVINSSLANVIKLLTENSTTRDEKVNIIQRFDKVKTLTESKQLYDTISTELKKAPKAQNPSLDIQISEQKKTKQETLNENALYQCDDLNEMVGLIERMNRI